MFNTKYKLWDEEIKEYLNYNDLNKATIYALEEGNCKIYQKFNWGYQLIFSTVKGVN